MDVTSHTHVSARRSVARAVLVHRDGSPVRGTLASLLVGAGAGIVGLGLGRHFAAQGDPVALADGLFTLVLAASAPLPLVAVGALYHHPLHATLLPWPVSAGQHLRLGLRLFGSGQWPWLFLVCMAVVAGAHGLGPVRLGIYLLFCLSALVGAALVSLGAAGLCAAIAERNSPWLRNLRAGLAGPFSSDRHAPFFYLPALAFGAAAFATSIAQETALLPLLGLAAQDTLASPGVRVGMLLFPALLGASVLLAGTLAYRADALNVIARVGQEARMVYGGQPAPEDPPYGRWLARLVPSSVAPHLLKELAEQSRMQRGLWAWIVLGLVATLLYSVGTGSPSAAAPVIGLVVVTWFASLPVRESTRSRGFDLLVTLPIRWHHAWLGRWLALAFVTAHVGGGVALALGLRHGLWTGAVVGASAVVTTLLSTSTTQPNTSARLASLVPAVGLAAGLTALAWPPGGLVLLTIVGVSAIAWGLRK